VGSGGWGSDRAAAGASLSLPAAVEATLGCGRLILGVSGSRSDSKAAGTSLQAPAAAGVAAGPAAHPAVPAATTAATTPPPCLHAWVTPRTPPHAPPCSPLPRARQLEPAPWRLVGGMAVDVRRPHQEDRPAQGQLTARALAFAITGGDDPPPPPRQGMSCAVCRDRSLMCGVGPPWSLRRHPSEAPSRSSLRCALRAPRGASRGTQACGGQPRIRHQLQAHRPREVVQAGLSLPRSMWGT
jgi:hypothetical protein